MIHARAGAPSKRSLASSAPVVEIYMRGESPLQRWLRFALLSSGHAGPLRCLVFHNSTITDTVDHGVSAAQDLAASVPNRASRTSPSMNMQQR